jgi:hypothetical protein
MIPQKRTISRIALIVYVVLLVLSAFLMCGPGGAVEWFVVMGLVASVAMMAGPGNYRSLGAIALGLAAFLAVNDYMAGKAWHRKVDEDLGWYRRSRPAVRMTLQECGLPETWLEDANSSTDMSFFELERNYEVDSYIKAAIGLQSLSHEAAIERLCALTRSQIGDRVLPLCRMLFVRRDEPGFVRPGTGGASFLGGTDYADWPLEPIELVDGIPFLIARGYLVAGFPEPAEKYLDYCLENCDWNPVRYVPKTAEEKTQALGKLVKSPKWKRPLDEQEREFLMSQIAR